MQLVKRYEVECDVLKYLYENFFFATYSQKDFEAGGKVLTYWHDAFYCLWNSGISEDLQQLIREYPDYELWVFGHSLGGVLASLSTMVTITRGIFPAERIKYISFGEPRIGNVVFAQSFDALVPYKYRIVREHDLIPNQPQNLDLWDVWYPNKMLPCDSYIICQGAEDPRCSDSGLDLTGNTHLEYFGVDLLEWHKSGWAKCCTVCPGRK